MESNNTHKQSNPAITVAESRIKKEYARLEFIVKHFPRVTWFSYPALFAIITIVCTGFIAYNLFSPEKFEPLVYTFLVANVAIYFILLFLTLWFQFKFVKPGIWTMKDRFSKFKEANTLLEENDVKSFMKKIPPDIAETKREDTILPFVFLISLFSEWGSPDLNRTKMIYELFKSEEEERVSLFIDGSRRFLLWIVRIGIIGTFLGLMTAFVFMGRGLPEIFAEGGGGEDFRRSISLLMNESLFGYAAAVLSSLAANVASILIEFFALRKLQRFNLAYWMDAVFQWYIISSRRDVNLMDDVKHMLNTIQNVSSAVQTKVVEIDKLLLDANFYKDFPAVLSSMSKSMATINRMAHAISTSLGSSAKALPDSGASGSEEISAEESPDDNA